MESSIHTIHARFTMKFLLLVIAVVLGWLSVLKHEATKHAAEETADQETLRFSPNLNVLEYLFR